MPVLAVSSVSRAYYGPAAKRTMAEGGDDPRNWLAAAKESGDVEYAAAVFMFLDTSQTMDPDGWAAARLIVAKSRRGRTGFVGLRFHGPSGVFMPFAGSLERLGPAARDSEDDQRVLDAVRRRPGMTARDLRSACGMAAKRADAAIQRLLEGEQLEPRTVKRLNAGGKVRAARVIVLAGSDPLDGEGSDA